MVEPPGEGVVSLKRDHFRGDADRLVDALRPLVEEHGPSFCRYGDESKNCSDAKLVHGDRGVEGHHSLLGAMKALQANLVFPKIIIHKALQKIYEENRAKWRLSQAESQDYIETLSRRLRNLCRCCAQGEVKSKDSAWVRDLPWNRGQAISSTPAAPLKAISSTPAAPKASFDTELLLPYRFKGTVKETGLPIDLARCKELGRVVASWPDGSEEEVDSLTLERLECLVGSRPGRARSSPDLWEMEHHISRHTVSVRQKVDRNLLVILFEQKRQILQVYMRSFGEVADERYQVPDTHPACVAAVEFMSTIGEKYCKGDLQKTSSSLPETPC